jgi:hypothetical protein
MLSVLLPSTASDYSLGTCKLVFFPRERPFNLKGGYVLILIPNVAEKNILILVEEKKNNLIQSLPKGKGHTTIYKTLHRKLNIEQHEHH